MLVIVYSQAFSQKDQENWITEVYDLNAISTSENELFTYLIERSLNPFDLNLVTREELSSLYILSEDEIDKIISYRSEYGQFSSIYELQNVEGLKSSSIKKLKSFVKVSHGKVSQDWSGYGLIRIERILEKQDGFTNNSFNGTPERILSKIRVTDNSHLKFGLVVEKDAGEKIYWDMENKYYVFDHIGGFAQYQGKRFVKQLIIGDFTTLWGQGLVAGGGFFIGKGRESILTIKRNQTKFQPLSSSSEFGSFHGGAIEMSSGKVSVSTFYSRQYTDARIGEFGNIISMPSSGYHRTSSEIEKRKKVVNQVIGLNLSIPFTENFKFGSSFIFNHLNKKLDLPSYSYRKYDLTGSESFVSGINLEYRKNNVVLFGESAYSNSGGTAFIAGSIISFSHKVDGIFLFRNYSRDFNSNYAYQAFRESTNANNEKGTYWGMKLEPFENITFSLFADLYTFPWLTYSTKSPSYGSDIMLNAVLEQDLFSTKLYVRIRNKEKSVKPSSTKTFQTFQQNITHINLDSKIHLTENVALRISVWHSIANRDTGITSGNLIYQDILIKYSKMSITARFALIDAQTPENTFYAYEPDLLYSFSVPSYRGNAVKYFILFKRKISRKLSIWMKWSRINYHDRDEIGSGTNTIHGSKKSEIKAQVIAKF